MSFQKFQGLQIPASADFHGMEMSLLYWFVNQKDLRLTGRISSLEGRGDDESCCAYHQERGGEYSLCHGKALFTQ